MEFIDRLKEKRAQAEAAFQEYQKQATACLGAIKVLDDLLAELAQERHADKDE